jgi:hypothetical protein
MAQLPEETQVYFVKPSLRGHVADVIEFTKDNTKNIFVKDNDFKELENKLSYKSHLVGFHDGTLPRPYAILFLTKNGQEIVPFTLTSPNNRKYIMMDLDSSGLQTLATALGYANAVYVKLKQQDEHIIAYGYIKKKVYRNATIAAFIPTAIGGSAKLLESKEVKNSVMEGYKNFRKNMYRKNIPGRKQHRTEFDIYDDNEELQSNDEEEEDTHDDYRKLPRRRQQQQQQKRIGYEDVVAQRSKKPKHKSYF